MLKLTRILLLVSVLAFLVLLGLAVAHESTYYLYIASAVPLLIVPLLPDIRSNQYIKKGKTHTDVWITRTPAEDGAGSIVIAFEPGYVAWHKRRLYFHIDDIPAAPIATASHDITAAIAALRFDLAPHPRKKGWVGIELAHLAARTQGLAYTIDDVNRIVLSAADVKELLPQGTSSAAAAAPAASNHSMEA